MKFIHTADTHLGFELIKTAPPDEAGRKRRAQSVFDNFVAAVEHTLAVEADLFIHSGDLFNKYYIVREKLDALISPFDALSKAGVPAVIIPGNHERSEFPFDLFHGLRGIYVLDRPKSLLLSLNGYSVGIAGFPFIKDHVKSSFLNALNATEYAGQRSDFNILVTHQTFDEALVGPVGFRFKAGRPDTVSRDTVPLDFEYIAAGHIHRYQVLPHPLKPGLSFVYPGSVQRMSFAEMDEEKGFVEGEVINGRIETRFIPLPAWEMKIVEIEAAGRSPREVENTIRDQFRRFNQGLVIRFNLVGGVAACDYPEIDFCRMRAEMPRVLECQFAIRAKTRWIHR
ncbi:MAG: metallophosphoesterase [Deltaproteobacteria bacterium]|nr:metallophosphoesterase [Deltaproteobacteria bacterium]